MGCAQADNPNLVFRSHAYLEIGAQQDLADYDQGLGLHDGLFVALQRNPTLEPFGVGD
jgi:hypothetical protein